MAVPEAYVVVPSSLTTFLQAIQTAGVPPRVTFEFLKTLGLTSSNDRSVITVMKAIGFLDQSGAPTDLYRAYRNTSEAPRVLGKALRQAYADLFMANLTANTLSNEKLQGIVATKTGKGERVVKEIVRTFKTLAKHADFNDTEEVDTSPTANATQEVAIDSSLALHAPETATSPTLKSFGVGGLHYNIQIHLPTTTDITVYNAIFRALKEQLL